MHFYCDNNTAMFIHNVLVVP